MKFYEVTLVDSGKTYVMKESNCRKTFGKDEWKEIKAGYDPAIIVFESKEQSEREISQEEVWAEYNAI